MILLIDNYDSFTWNLVQRFAEVEPSLEVGRDLVVVRNDAISLVRVAEGVAALDGGRGPTHIVVSPGPCTPMEAGVSNEVVRRFAGRVPILGVCLGHQCLAAVHGMRVERHAVPVHGKTSEIFHDGRGVFAGLPNPFTAMRYHSLAVAEETVAEGWEVSAWAYEGERKVVMGLRRVWGDGADARTSPVEGVQFHPESFLTAEGPRLLKNFLGMAARR